MLGREGVACCPKGFSGHRPPPTRTGVGTPRLGAVSGVPSGSHPLLLRDPLGLQSEEPWVFVHVSVRLLVRSGGGVGGKVSLLNFHSNCSRVTLLLPKV